jgi:arginyl-tRNA synthetase
MTQDIGTAIMRFDENPGLTSQIYTVGNEQDYHFKVLFKILDKLGYDWAKDCHHLSYGMVELPEGKMKSREGTVVDADDLMEEMVRTAEEITTELGKLDGVADDEKKELYEVIGLGALKYFLLKVDPKKKMMFDPAESIDFSGNTGPFIQYTHARIKSILRKYGKPAPDSINSSVELHPMEREVIHALYQFPKAMHEAAENYSPALIANYIYDLVKTFNSYYQAVPILKEENADTLEMRIALIAQVAEVVKKGMGLLGISVPERM